MAREISPIKKLLVTDTLPDQFLYDLGAYIQTCAHIEVAVCDFICATEGFRPNSIEWNEKFHTLRKAKASDLIPLLKKCSAHLPEPLRSQLDELAEWIKLYSINRHIAVHGAFFHSNTDGSLRVLYTHKRKNGGTVEYVPEEAIVDRGQVLEFLIDADRILRTLVSVVKAIDQGDIVLGNRKPSNVQQ